MTKEEKELLFIDLCGRLPYYPYALFDLDKKFDGGFQAPIIGMVNKGNTGVIKYNQTFYAYGCMTPFSIDEFRIYLRPMSSMTEEEFEKLKEYSGLKYEQLDLASYQNGTYKCLDFYLSEIPSYVVVLVFDWLNAHHFDYRGFIEKGLAIEVTKENNPYDVK